MKRLAPFLAHFHQALPTVSTFVSSPVCSGESRSRPQSRIDAKSLAHCALGRVEVSDFTNYIRPLYNKNNNCNQFSAEDSNALHFSALLSSLENLLKILFH